MKDVFYNGVVHSIKFLHPLCNKFLSIISMTKGGQNEKPI